jgi:hypothetical protein
MDNQNKDLNRRQDRSSRKQQGGQSSQRNDSSVGRKPGEMDAPKIPENARQNFE